MINTQGTMMSIVHAMNARYNKMQHDLLKSNDKANEAKNKVLANSKQSKNATPQQMAEQKAAQAWLGAHESLKGQNERRRNMFRPVNLWGPEFDSPNTVSEKEIDAIYGGKK